MATGSLGTLYTDRRAGEGNLPRSMPCLQVSHASDNAVAELSNTLKSSRAVGSPTLPPRHLGREQSLRSRPFLIRHLVPPPAGFFVVADEKRSVEVDHCLTKMVTKKT